MKMKILSNNEYWYKMRSFECMSDSLDFYISKKHLNVTQILIGLPICLSQSEVVLHSSLQIMEKKRKIVLENGW